MRPNPPVLYDCIPRFVAVQVSPERWQVCKVHADAGETTSDGAMWFPLYEPVGKPLSAGKATNLLAELSR